MGIPPTNKNPMKNTLSLQAPDDFINVGINEQRFEQLIRSKGIRMVHSKPFPCPNIKDVHSADHDPSCNMCQNGMVYYDPKPFQGGFQSMTNNRSFMVNGQWDFTNAMINMPLNYDDGTPMDLQLYDRISCPDISTRYYQRVEHSQQGIDRLQFPAVSIDVIYDANGKNYTNGIDYTVNSDGNVEWLNMNRPGYNVEIERGVIYSIVYYTRPVFTITGLPHEFRLTQTIDASGNPVEQRFPQLAIVKRDYIVYRSDDKVGSANSPEPRDGSFE